MKRTTKLREVKGFQDVFDLEEIAHDARSDIMRLIALLPELGGEEYFAKLKQQEPQRRETFDRLRKSAQEFHEMMRVQLDSFVGSGIVEMSGLDIVSGFNPFRSEIYPQLFSDFLDHRSEHVPSSVPVMPERTVSCWQQLDLLTESGWRTEYDLEFEPVDLRNIYRDDDREVYWLRGLHAVPLERSWKVGSGMKVVPQGKRPLNLVEGIALMRHAGEMLGDCALYLEGSRMKDGSVPVAVYFPSEKSITLMSADPEECIGEGRRSFVPCARE